jgi:hypothetical protein
MRISFLFVVVWILLVLNRGSDMAFYYSQYRVIGKLQAAVEASPRSGDDTTPSDLAQRQGHFRQMAVSAGFDLLFASVLCVLFFLSQRRKLAGASAAAESNLQNAP